MTRPRSLAAVAVATAASLFLAGPAHGQDPDSPAAAGEPEPPGAEPAALAVKVEGARRGRVRGLRRATVIGTLRPFVAGQRARVLILRDGKVLKRERVRFRRVQGRNLGRFRLRTPRLVEPARYRVVVKKRRTAEQAGARAATNALELRYPTLRQGDFGRAAAILNGLLRDQGYYAPSRKGFSGKTTSAVLAYQKVNGMAPTGRAGSEVFKQLLRGRGAFNVRREGAGRHVEVDVSKQVMVLADGSKPLHTFHISSGKPSTPSDLGAFRFYRRDRGYNELGMLHSIYYNRGEAVHGYGSVPTYPASNGCIRVPTHSAWFVYEWVRLGMRIYVY